jgi:nucleoside-diphosphate-sugar epimerase
MRALIVGCGYVGRVLAARLLEAGHEVTGLRRSAPLSASLPAGLRFIQADITRPESLAQVASAYDWVVDCVSSSHGDVAAYRAVYLEGMRNLLQWLRPTPPARFVYTSSTGVYGQGDGSIVDEQSPAIANTENAQVLLDTEKLLLDAALQEGFPGMVVRVAGIYGPERGFWFRQFLAGEARLEGEGGRILNSIHVEDVAGSIVAALQRGTPGAVYNAADDQPVTQLEFFTWVASALNRPLPGRIPHDAALARKRGLTNKRVSNHRLKTELGYVFKFPTFREGYAAEIERLWSDPSGMI